jgi:hypothetical protein
VKLLTLVMVINILEELDVAIVRVATSNRFLRVCQTVWWC